MSAIRLLYHKQILYNEYCDGYAIFENLKKNNCACRLLNIMITNNIVLKIENHNEIRMHHIGMDRFINIEEKLELETLLKIIDCFDFKKFKIKQIIIIMINDLKKTISYL